MPEITKAQIIALGVDRPPNPLPQSYDTYRTMRKNPTLALARAFSMAPIIASEWSLQSDDDASDEWVDWLHSQLLPLRETFMTTTCAGVTDFGWQPFELIFELADGRIRLKRLKPLLHDITQILISADTGMFNGFYQTNSDITVPVQFCLNVALRVEGTNWYGTSVMENARDAFNSWTEAQAAASKYDRKIAGTSVIIYYPDGQTEYNGAMKSNADIASDLMELVTGSGSLIIPRTANEDLGGESVQWKVDYQGDSSPKQYSFNNRLQYLDTIMIRAMLMPERTVAEGHFGTKAEAQAHGDLALTQRELDNREIVRHLNWHVVDRLLEWNFGPQAKGMVRIEPAPLANEALTFLREVYRDLLRNPAALVNELANIDLDSMKSMLGVPKLANVDQTPTSNTGLTFEVADEVVDEVPASDDIELAARKVYGALGIGARRVG